MHKPRRIRTPIYSAQDWKDEVQGDRRKNGRDLSLSIPPQALINGMGERRYYHGDDTVQNKQHRQQSEKGHPPISRPLLFHPPDDLMSTDDLLLAKARSEARSSTYPRFVVGLGWLTSQERRLPHKPGWLGLYGDHEDEAWLKEDAYNSTVYYPGKPRLALILLSGLLPYIMVG